jgi:hypothetical protein
MMNCNIRNRTDGERRNALVPIRVTESQIVASHRETVRKTLDVLSDKGLLGSRLCCCDKKGRREHITDYELKQFPKPEIFSIVLTI